MTGPSKSCCLKAIPTGLLKKTLPVHRPVLCKIINMTYLDKGIFLERLKATDVTPIIKKDLLDQNALKSYRPMSNLAYD